MKLVLLARFANCVAPQIKPFLIQPYDFAVDKFKITGIDSRVDISDYVQAVGTLWDSSAGEYILVSIDITTQVTTP